MKTDDHTNYRGKKRSEFWTPNTDEDMCVQSDAHLTSVQAILSKFGVEGISLLNDVDAKFLDVTQFNDYQDLMQQRLEAEGYFMTLDPRVRDVFENSVDVFLDTAHDQEKRDELARRGLIKTMEAITPKGPDGTAGGTDGGSEEESGS